eukprot:TRINITY_DN29491_c0_g1_i1.p1 TRINITY_DN29491_c0_g1~~TRINITY_DN29491_c0_g1_i1.p1  ORF type:complete len:952 (+),score=112.91 TRINITY_DN29491_c0_g1_i1:111-2966(+)
MVGGRCCRRAMSSSDGDDSSLNDDESDEVELELNEAAVLAEEREALAKRHTLRFGQDPGRTAKRFSLAFSGGGIRAASFQAGVLWRLAEMDKLQDVEYLVGVSGGAYIASALTSHVIHAGSPAPGEPLSKWYLGIVARTVARMQKNIGYLLSDIGVDAFAWHHDGSARLPRICDYPILGLLLLITLTSIPITFLVQVIVPMGMLVDVFFGGFMRIAFCLPPAQALEAFWMGQLFRNGFMILVILVSLTFCITLLVDVVKLRCLQPARVGKSGRSLGWLIVYGTRGFLVRMTFAVLLVWLLIGCAVLIQIYDYDGHASRYPVCNGYKEVFHYHCQGLGQQDLHAFWNETYSPHQMTNLTAPVRHANFMGKGVGLLGSLLELLLWFFVASVMLTPFFPTLLLRFLFLLGPMLLFTVAEIYIIWRVFSPLTGQSINWYAGEGIPFAFSQPFELACLATAIVMTPIVHRMHNTVHQYYKRGLRRAFFADGQDIGWHELETSSYCPFLLLTGTVNDYQQPGSSQHIHEISFTYLHTGSPTTGYIRTHPHMQLAKTTALAGAATDAFVLGRLQHIKYRFWLEVFNLGMGDFIPFENRQSKVATFMRGALYGLARSFTPKHADIVSHNSSHVMLRAVNSALMMAMYSLFLWASAVMTHALDVQEELSDRCRDVTIVVACAASIALLTFAGSFYGFLPGFEVLLHGPGIRLIHQATQFYHQADRPPSLIYVTDGGLQDCCGLMQLMRRRSERILLVLAAEDPDDDLSVLKVTMDMVQEAKLGSFYDPEDPRRDINVMFDRYRKDKSIPYLHLGIVYGWDDGSDSRSNNLDGQACEAHGHLIIVKNRVPPHLMEEGLPPLLTEETVLGQGYESDSSQTDEGLRQTELGGCCCDCCHYNGCNCGTRFPHIPSANQCFTPQLFSCLCRLGHAVSLDGIEKLTAEFLSSDWEASVLTRSRSAP